MPSRSLRAAVAFAALVIVSPPTFAEEPGRFSGPYIGINAGAAWSRSSFATNPNCPPSVVDAIFCNASPDPSAVNGTAVAASGTGGLWASGATGGVQAGYNWQAGTLVYGAETDFGILDLHETATADGVFPFAFLGTQYALAEAMKAHWLATVRARLGFTVTPSILLFATGGLALAQFKFSSSYSDNAIDVTLPGGTGFGSRSEIRAGWAVGSGVEWSLDGRWSIKAEYLYVNLGSIRVPVPTNNTPAFNQTMLVDADLATHIARVGLNYRY